MKLNLMTLGLQWSSPDDCYDNSNRQEAGTESPTRDCCFRFRKKQS